MTLIGQTLLTFHTKHNIYFFKIHFNYWYLNTKYRKATNKHKGKLETPLKRKQQTRTKKNNERFTLTDLCDQSSHVERI